MSTSDRTHDPLGLPPLPDPRAPTPREPLATRETRDTQGTHAPETLIIPPQAVSWLIMKAFSSDLGDAWLRGFITAHGEPGWFLDKHWGLKVGTVEIVKTPPSGPPEVNGAP